jgi:hypothetical protein
VSSAVEDCFSIINLAINVFTKEWDLHLLMFFAGDIHNVEVGLSCNFDWYLFIFTIEFTQKLFFLFVSISGKYKVA